MAIGYHKVGLLAGFVALLQSLTLPITSFLMLYLAAYAIGIRLTGELAQPYLALGVIASLLSYMFASPRPHELSGMIASGWTSAERLAFAWAGVVGCLLLFGYVAQVSAMYSRRVLLIWFLLTPAVSVAFWVLLRAWLRQILIRTGNGRTVVIAGVNKLSQKLASNMEQHAEFGLAFKGYFEDRNAERIGFLRDGLLLGNLQALPDYVRQNSVDMIFIAIPISHIVRMHQLLDSLKNTTASIYFVPDIFVVDLIQSRTDEVNGIPVLALCETPFYSWRGVMKRLSDLVIASTMFILAAPAMLFIALAIKLTTNGSVIFRQRRYGLDGSEIVVYKFRTMTVSEDGTQVAQATHDDARVTPIGRFLRRTSLDELPQIVNVLQGRMSVVGPRPHAVAHNETYRKLIKGYMVRHKVTPGITGLAQVNGCRGETNDVADMERRIRYDLQYLREWSLMLDFKILVQTAKTLLGDKKAY